jgi:integrase
MSMNAMRNAHGDVMAVQSKRILRGGMHLAVMANVLAANPERDVSPMRAKSRPKGAQALTADELRDLFAKLRESEACQRHDLVDPITLFIATGLRISELLGLQWEDFNEDTSTLTVSGKVIRAAGKGLMRVDETKMAAARSRCRRSRPPCSSRAGPCRIWASKPWCSRPRTERGATPTTSVRAGARPAANLGSQTRRATASARPSRRSSTTKGLSARIGADHLGHTRISMTQDKYMARGRVHTAVAELLDRTTNDE